MKTNLAYPEPGFYYHYKHDSTDTLGNFAYEVLNIGYHTEIKDSDEGVMVIYRPLYPEAKTYQDGKYCDLRPVTGPDGFMTPKMNGEESIERFRKIDDLEIITKLSEIRDQLYSV